MATIILGLDKNLSPSEDYAFQDAVAKVLKKAGHSVEKLERAPNPFASYSYSSKAKGKIGVYLIADGIFSIADLYSGNTNFKYAYFGIRGDLGRSRMDSKSDFENNPIGADSDCTGICDKLRGKTYPQINKIVKSKCQAVFGKTGEEMGKAILDAMGGSTSTSSSDTKNVGTIKDAIREVQSGWDGDVECFIRGDKFYVQKIKLPPGNSKLELIEGKNIFLNSVRVTDVNPSSANHLTVKWKGTQFVLQDADLIKRFGKITGQVDAPEDMKTKKEAEDFARLEWLKLKRENGHKLECEVRGSSGWQIGRWVRVYLPTFNINDYMYITKASHDDEHGDWVTKLVLLDYPPSLGKPEDYEKETDDEETEEEDVDDGSE